MVRTIEKHCRGCVLVFLVILLFVSAFAAGADKGQQSPDREGADKRTARQWLRTRVTYSCVNLPIDTVLMDLAEQAKIDIIKSPKVTGNVTVKVTDVPLEEALTNILAAHDYMYIATESMIRVMPLSETVVMKEQLVTRIYRITYADASDVAEALSEFVSEKGKTAFNKGTSHIIVTDTESKIKAIDKFIEEIDHVTPQVLVEVRIYDITSKEGFELGAQWYAGRNAPLTADIIPPTETRTTVFEETTEGNYRDADDGTGEMTTEGRTIETRVIEPATITNRRRKPFVGGSFDRIRGGTLRFSVLNDAVDLELALNILHTQVEAKLLANPRILVLDNETANFEIVREIPYRELRQVAREDPMTYTEFKNVGVELKVTPHVTKDGMLRLHIVPKFSVLVSQDLHGVPTIDTRRVDTIALVEDGQTIVLGGLRKREVRKDISKVPVLGDIPLIGGLFKSEIESVEINELVVFITTKIITKPTLSRIEKKQLGATVFAGPEMTKTRIKHNNRLKTGIDTDELDVDVTDITKIFDQLLRGRKM